jgi:hypothetical protein
MNQSGKRLTFALLGVASLFYVNAPSLAEDQIAPQIKVVPLDAGDQPYLLLLKGQPETKSFRSGLVPAVADLSQKQVHQTRGLTAWLKKITPHVTSSRFNSSCLRKPSKGDYDGTQAKPLHRQSRSNATLDRTGKNNSNQWS